MNKKLLTAMQSMNDEELYEALYTDPLTGAKNRRAFEMAEYKTVAILDIDSLKYINDNHGHRLGDEYMIRLVRWAKHAFGEDVYRLGGDEFAVTSVLDAETVDAMLTHLQKSQKYFTFGISTNIPDADSELISNKAIREGLGLRSPRGEQPPWEVK